MADEGYADGMTTTPLEDHAVVGNMRTLAMITDRGTVDWMCWPRFDSGSVFGSLLDDDGGSWTLHPVEAVESTRQSYLSATNVLVTRFHTTSALVEIEDWMTVHGDDRHLIRSVRCHRGSVTMTSTVDARPDYGRARARLEHIADGCVTVSSDDIDLALTLSGSVGWEIDHEQGLGVAETQFTISAGESVHLALGDSAIGVQDCDEAYTDTTRFWHAWSSASTYTGRWREAVERSALALKLLTHEPTGGIIAAGTTSLPESIGGERNWDYRYVWMRDAGFVMYAFIELGYLAEADAFTAWLVARLEDCDDREGSKGPPLSPLYDLDGKRDLDEVELGHWSGWRDSRPVRIGNDASGQFQLDIFGELIDGLYLADKHGNGLSIGTWRHICTIIDWLDRHWQEPDDGMWESRNGAQRHTSSLLMAWVAVERAIRMSNHRGRPAPLERWMTMRDDMHTTLVDRGWNGDLGAFTQTLDGDTVDASILLAPLVKFISPDDPLWRSTLGVVADRLAHGPLVDRYDTDTTNDGLEGGEGSMTICSFWHVEALARSGAVTDARILFDRLLSYASPAGLFSEQIGPDGRQIGNTPQAFTHLALISAAVCLDELLDEAE